MKNRKNGWIGCDFDGTLAVSIHGQYPKPLGPPIPKMVRRVKKWLRKGKKVKIFTARVAPRSNETRETVKEMTEQIEAWCLEHIGQKLEVTCIKDSYMYELWDDRCVQVIRNTGKRVKNKKADKERKKANKTKPEFLG